MIESGKKNPTMNDIAEEAGVSNATVSRYLNNTSYIEETKKEKIRKAIIKLDYTQNKIARSLRTLKSHQIMLVVPDIQNPFYSSIYKTIQDICYQNEYTVLLYNTDDQLENEIEAINLINELRIDGLIYCSTNDYRDIVDRLKKLNIPIVSSNSFDNLIFDTIHSKKGESVYLGTKHLTDLGHKRIAYAGGNSESILNTRRLEGYLRALKEMEIEERADYVFSSQFTLEGGIEAAKYFLSLEEKPTAIACANDLIAIGIIKHYQSLGLKIPKDLSVTGVDNIIYSELLNPSLTTVTNDSVEFANKAMSLLLPRLSNKYNGETREIFTTRQLVVRESTQKI